MSVIGRVLLSGAATVAIGFSLLAVTAPLRAQQYGPGPGGVYCASNDNRFARCQVPWRDAELVQQSSKTRCIRDQTWGFDRQGIWVDRGCRGQFAPARGGWPPYGGPGPQRPPQQVRVRCESHGSNYQRCPVELRRDDSVRLVNRLSSADCREGRSWGWTRDGIWVDRGCRADFVVERRY
ncbi:DUF3011 domain-containing protein [Dyella humi]|uniref:DUF3011 domain-containing protein n=1 Tax=Dyella humi TaxID=1770547 RepID=A0ABW8IL83_9GAMM